MTPTVEYRQILFWPIEIIDEEMKPEAGDRLERWARMWAGSGGAWTPVSSNYDRSSGTEGATGAPNRYAEYLYFHRFTQRFLYSENGAAFRILSRDDVRRVKVVLADRTTVELEVARIHLYLFQTEIGILVMEFAGKNLDRRVVLQLQDQLRRVYPPYWQLGGRGGNCPLSVEWLDGQGNAVGRCSTFHGKNDAAAVDDVQSVDRPLLWELDHAKEKLQPVSGHWAWLLEPLKPYGKQGGLSYDQIEDDRMPEMSLLVHGAPHSISDADMVRLCFYDGPGHPDDPEVAPYTEAFLSDFASNYCYDRFWDRRRPEMNTRYLCCGYGFTMIVGSANGWLAEHFRRHYFQLGLLAHYHRASLLRFSRRFSASYEHEYVRRVRRDFADFLNRQWFSEVTNQDQGKELFQLWSMRLGNERLLQRLMKESDAVDAILSADRDAASQKTMEDLTKSVDDLTRRLVWLAFLTMAAAVLTMVVAFTDMEAVRDFWGFTPESHERHQWLRWTLAGAGLCAAAVAVTCWQWWRKHATPR